MSETPTPQGLPREETGGGWGVCTRTIRIVDTGDSHAHWAWAFTDTGELHSPVFYTPDEAVEWMDNRTKGQYLKITSVEPPESPPSSLHST